MSTLIQGCFITAFFSALFLCGGAITKRSVALKLKRAYRKNCVENAQLKIVSEDETRHLYTATYGYQFRGEQFEYIKYYFDQDPQTTVKLIWDANHPEKPVEVSSLHPDMKPVLPITAAAFVITWVCGLFLPQLSIIFLSALVGCVWSRDYSLCKVGIAFFAFSVFISTILWMNANLDPGAYYEVSYTLGDHYMSTGFQLAIIDELEPYEVCHLYEDVSWINQQITEGTLGRKTPVFGQFTNKHWQESPLLEWPSGYERYANWEYRTEILKESGHY